MNTFNLVLTSANFKLSPCQSLIYRGLPYSNLFRNNPGQTVVIMDCLTKIFFWIHWI